MEEITISFIVFPKIVDSIGRNHEKMDKELTKKEGEEM